ncbi:MAG: esterase-like activity of phytase family protein [Hyphomicrobiales bacterium]
MKLFALLAAGLVGLAQAAAADPVAIAVTPVASFAAAADQKSFGPFEWRGGLELTSSDEKFGGLSGLILSAGCTGLLAVSDAGRWFRGRLAYDGATLSGLAEAELAWMLDEKGRPPQSKPRGDAEAVADLGGGKVLVGFESRPRIGIYDIGKSGLAAPFQPVKSPREIKTGPGNEELEAVGRFAAGPLQGDFIAISEFNADAKGDIRAWVWNAKRTATFSLRRHEDYKITDLALLPDGGILMLERSFGSSLLPGMAIRRFESSDIRTGGTVEPELLFSGRAPFHAIDNMEGIAICERGGETRLTIVSDNNFNTGLQRTLLLQFAYRP